MMLKESVKRTLTAEELLEIPDVLNAVEEFIEIRDQYRRAVRRMFIDIVDDELPNVDVINAKYEMRLKNQSDKLAELVVEHRYG